MGFRKLIFAALLLEGCCVLSQYVQNPTNCACVSSSSITPAGQFVIPAIIKPILQPETVAVAAPAPVVPSYPDFSGFGGLPGPGGFSPAPYGGMPPIIFDDDGGRNNHHWLYWLILLLSRRGSGGGCAGSYGGNYGGGCGGCDNSGCSSGNSNTYNANCGGGFNGNGCSCGGCTFIPYPVPVPCGSSTGFPSFDCGCSNDVNACSGNCNQTPEINLVIRTADSGCSCTSS